MRLFHVLTPKRGKAGAQPQMEIARRQLRSLIPAEAESRGLESSVEVVEHRDPALAISQAAERFRADLVCLASHGRTGLLRTVMGSVAEAVLHRTARPLLVVRPELK